MALSTTTGCGFANHLATARPSRGISVNHSLGTVRPTRGRGLQHNLATRASLIGPG